MEGAGTDFRFERLDVYRSAVEVTSPLFDIAEQAELLKKFRFANQLEGAALSVTNNIAEGSGSDSDIEFARFVGIARKSVYECANILLILNHRRMIVDTTLQTNYQNLIGLSVKLFNFRKTLLKRHADKS